LQQSVVSEHSEPVETQQRDLRHDMGLQQSESVPDVLRQILPAALHCPLVAPDPPLPPEPPWAVDPPVDEPPAALNGTASAPVLHAAAANNKMQVAATQILPLVPIVTAPWPLASQIQVVEGGTKDRLLLRIRGGGWTVKLCTGGAKGATNASRSFRRRNRRCCSSHR